MIQPRNPAAMRRPRIALVAGTRPECLKLASTWRALAGRADVQLVSSGQHLQMVRHTLAHLGLAPDVELPAVPQPATLSRSVRHLRDGVQAHLSAWDADLAVVQGDTSTAYAGALAARAAGVPLAHLEAGLRTSDPRRPFPEEPFRRRIAPLARWHFAPTAGAAAHLRAEGVADAAIHVVGNPIVDLLRETLAQPADDPCPTGWRARFARLLTLTLHRRENYGRGLDVVCGAMRTLLDTHPDLGLVCPVHPNPAIGARMRRQLQGHPRALLVAPLDYRPFVRLLADSALVVTDSGGIQEEVPYLGVPTLVVREATERPEALQGGVVQLVPPQPPALLAAIDAALARPRPAPVPFDARAPFGDGRSGERVATVLLDALAGGSLRGAA